MPTGNRTQPLGLTNRRDFLRAGAAVASASLLNLPGRGAGAATRGGHLRAGLAHGSTTDTLDPGHFENGFMWMLGYMAFNNLTEIDAGGQLVGELATSWEPDAAATRWEFELRRDVEWHDGKSLEAEDVIASLNHHRGEGTTSGTAPLVSDIDTITARGKHRVVFQLSRAMSISPPSWPASPSASDRTGTVSSTPRPPSARGDTSSRASSPAAASRRAATRTTGRRIRRTSPKSPWYRSSTRPRG